MNDIATNLPTVVVVGGGYGGVNVAKALDDVADVVLVEPRQDFHHNVAALRALVDPTWLPQIFLPYGGLLANGRVVQDRAVRVDARKVVLGSGEEIPADYIVLASGSRYPFPAKSASFDTQDAHVGYQIAHGALAGADRVLLLGAGPVGIELAGEIKAVWPDKGVILLDVADDVLDGPYMPELRVELRSQLAERGVELVLGSALRELPDTSPGHRETFTVTTEAGTELTADLWYRTHGVIPVTDYLADDLATARRPDGSLDVTAHLRLAGHGTVFAIGDISAADRNMAGIASLQAALVAENITSLINGDVELAEWQRFPAAIVIPIGPDGGSGQLPGNDELVTREFVAELKGRDMLVDRYADVLGADVPARQSGATTGAAVAADR